MHLLVSQGGTAHFEHLRSLATTIICPEKLATLTFKIMRQVNIHFTVESNNSKPSSSPTGVLLARTRKISNADTEVRVLTRLGQPNMEPVRLSLPKLITSSKFKPHHLPLPGTVKRV
jgi:hypothetical protein